MRIRINEKNLCVADALRVEEDLDAGAGDQVTMLEYPNGETKAAMLLTQSTATRDGKNLANVRENGRLWWMRPDGKNHVTDEPVQQVDGSVEPRKTHIVVISTRRAHLYILRSSKFIIGDLQGDAGLTGRKIIILR